MDASFVALLARASLQAGVLAMAVWIACRMLPALPAGARAALWWAVALKFLLGLAWVAPIPVPVLSPTPLPPSSASLVVVPGGVPATAVAAEPGGAQPASRVPLPTPTWTQAGMLAWAASVVALAVIALRRARGAARAIRESQPAPAALLSLTMELSQRLGIRAPRVLVSDEVASPFVHGPWKAAIVLPSASIDVLTPDQQAMVVCHELVHIRRRDLWTGLVPELARVAFFFHPLAHLVAREYRLAREAACDAEVLQTLGAEPRDYGRLLLALAVPDGDAAFVAAGASGSFAHMKRRLQMLTNEIPTPRSRRVGRFLLGGAAMALLPIQIVARPIDPWIPARAADVSLAPLAAARTSGIAVADESADTPAIRSTGEGQSRGGSTDARDFEWMVLRADGHTMAGSDADRARVQRLQKDGEPLLWVRIKGREHVIRDPQIIRDAESAFDDVEAIGRKMGEIGGQQGRIGARQAEVGAQQAAIGAKQAELGAKIAELAQRQAALALEKAARALQRASERRDVRSEAAEGAFDEQMQALGKQVDALGAQLETLAKPMEEFGRQMAPLAAQLDAMGKEIERNVKDAEARVRALAERAIADGKAEIVK